MKTKSPLKKFLEFLKEDSWQSLLVFLILAVIVIRYILFPTLSLITGTYLPLVIVESCSMYHEDKGFEKVFEKDRGDTYEEYNINIQDTKNWDFQDGLDKGDVIFVVGSKNIEKGDVIIFSGGESHPIIHRVVKETAPYATKGDNNNLYGFEQLPNEKQITDEQVIGKAVFRVPYIGWIKLIFFEPFRTDNDRGFCN